MQTHGSIQKEMSRRDTKHQTSICKKYISEGAKRGHSKNKTVSKRFVFADETSNINEMPEQQNKKLLHDKATKTYEKAPTKLVTSINVEAKNWMTTLSV